MSHFDILVSPYNFDIVRKCLFFLVENVNSMIHNFRREKQSSLHTIMYTYYMSKTFDTKTAVLQGIAIRVLDVIL